MTSSPTISQAIDRILEQIPGTPWKGSVDTVKSGDASQPVKGIVSTFTATREVLARAAGLGANFVITHEPTYYNHLDATEWLNGDPVFESKKRFLDEHNIVVWRFHDYWHHYRPDGIVTGMVRELGWETIADPAEPHVYLPRPAPTLRELAEFFKAKLRIPTVKYVGDGGMICSRVAMLVGAHGGERQIKLLGKEGIDVMVCGESPEWETCEYVRDAAAAGQKKALLILGHANSEEAGMQYLAEWITPLFPGVPIHFIPAGDPFVFV